MMMSDVFIGVHIQNSEMCHPPQSVFIQAIKQFCLAHLLKKR